MPAFSRRRQSLVPLSFGSRHAIAIDGGCVQRRSHGMTICSVNNPCSSVLAVVSHSGSVFSPSERCLSVDPWMVYTANLIRRPVRALDQKGVSRASRLVWADVREARLSNGRFEMSVSVRGPGSGSTFRMPASLSEGSFGKAANPGPSAQLDGDAHV